MALVVKESGGTSAPIEAGAHPARCVGVIDLGVQHNDFNGKDQEKVLLMFELPDERIQVDGEDKPRWLSKRYTASLHEKASLRKDLDAWRGKPFTAEELKGFDLASVVSAPCLITVTHTERNGNTYANISGVSKPMKGMEIPPLENEPVIFSIDSDNAESVFKTLPNWIKDTIEKSPTWSARFPNGFEDVTEEGEEELPF